MRSDREMVCMYETFGALTDLEYVNVITLEDLDDIEKTNHKPEPRRSVINIREYFTPEEIFEKYIQPLLVVDYPYNFEDNRKRDMALIATLYVSGLRVSELLSVKRSMVEEQDNFIVFKGVSIEKQRKVKLLDKALPRKGRLATFTKIVWNYIEPMKPQERLFDLNRTRVWQICKRLTGQWPHYFRSQYISYIVNEIGLSTLNVKSITGHATTSQLESYVHSSYKQFEEQLLK